MTRRTQLAALGAALAAGSVLMVGPATAASTATTGTDWSWPDGQWPQWSEGQWPEGEMPQVPTGQGLDGGAPDGHWQDGEQDGEQDQPSRDRRRSTRNDRSSRSRKAQEKAQREASQGPGAGTTADSTPPPTPPVPTQPGTTEPGVESDVGGGVGSPDAVRRETERLRKERNEPPKPGGAGATDWSSFGRAEEASSNGATGVRLVLLSVIVLATGMVLASRLRGRPPSASPSPSAVDPVEQTS